MSTRGIIPVVPGNRRSERLFQQVLPLLAGLAPDHIFQTFAVDIDRLRTDGALPERTVDAVRQAGVAIVGRLPSNFDGFEGNPNLRVRKSLGLFALITRARSRPQVDSPYQGVDLVVIREATEDVYAQIEHEVVPGVVQSIKVTTERASRRLAEFSFELARKEGIDDVVLVHKANIMKLTDGLLLKLGQEVAASYPEINCRSAIADAMAMQLVKAPERYRMLVCGNLFGDLLSDLATGLVGGPLASRVTGHGDGGLTVYHTILNTALREARPAKGPPLHFLAPAISLLRHLGYDEGAERLRDAIIAVAGKRTLCTPDLGGSATTEKMIAALADAM